MKRVRFESPLKVRDTNIMNHDFECHSPRPFTEKQVRSVASHRTFDPYNNCSPRVVPFTNDPIKKFDLANSSPYPSVNKTSSSNFLRAADHRLPSSDLDLSMLDFTRQEPRSLPQKMVMSENSIDDCGNSVQMPKCIFKTIEKSNTPPNNPPNSKNDNFFLKRHNISNLNDLQPLCKQVNKMCLEKENNPLIKKTEIMKLVPNLSQNDITKNVQHVPMKVNPFATEKDCNCNCHQCVKTTPYYIQPCHKYEEKENIHTYKKCCCTSETKAFSHLNYAPHLPIPTSCNCHEEQTKPQLNAVDIKTWALEKYEQSKKTECLDVEQQSTIVKEKREPTVSDLFKIIKLQNEQLQLLQEKVDKFIAASNTKENSVNPSIQNYVTEGDSLQSVDNKHHKISIGVMTSFEMVRTSTVINREVIKQGEAQIQCNRSQISIKEVVSKAQPVNINFLEGIRKKNNLNTDTSLHNNGDMTKNTAFEDKTFNELSLYNVQVDNETTPQMSPEQSMFLDVKDYSDSDTDSDDPANVGWTYYNKVMTRVNGMLQDSDMPSSASAMYRNTRQNCLMQIDKTNVSVTKRVTFGENPIEVQQPPMAIASTDTSLKMNQLAAKYLKYSQQLVQAPVAKPLTVASTDMSFATKNYMEQHKLLQGNNVVQAPRPQQAIPKFLDITVLKQQPKLL